MAKDFFDDEYDKTINVSENQNQDSGWYNAPTPKQVKKSNKPLYIVLMCIALVFCIALGWVLCIVFQSVGRDSAEEASDILQTVVDYMKNYYYKDVSDEDWTKAVELSGTALMQQTGDRFCQLLSPQSYYDLLHPTTVSQSGQGIFGISFLIEEGMGLYVSSITPNSNAYGRLQAGDIVLKLSEMRTWRGSAPVVNGAPLSEVVVSEWTSAAIQQIMGAVYSAKFHVLRQDNASDVGYSVVSYDIHRSVIPVDKYQLVEYYFNENENNISDTAVNGAVTSVYKERCLDQLPADTGYVRIVQFGNYYKGEEERTAYDEFAEVMAKFHDLELKHLVLDLKGNPGGDMEIVSDIASMLVTDAKLTATEKSKVVDGDNLLITYLQMPKPSPIRRDQYRESTYSSYFGSVGEKCDIAVWTDSGSASASELLTGCLLDYKTAVQMGTTTYGKGIAQSVVPLPFDGEATDINGNKITFNWGIYYTSASYYSPLGKNIHGVGYTPEGAFNNLSSYADLWSAVRTYWA